MAKKKKRANNNILFYIAIATVLILIWANYNSKKVQILSIEEYSETYETEAIIIKNEEIKNLNNQVDFTVKEGQRVSINKVLSDSKNITFTEYYNREIDIINWILDNEAYTDKNLFDRDISMIDEQIEDIEKDISWAENFNDSDKIQNLEQKKDELLKQKSYIINSFQYIGLNKDTLIELKEKYSGVKDSTGSSFTLNKLNFNFPGFIYFKSDGYENVLSKNILEFLTPEYIRNLENYNKNNNETSQTIKIVDDTYVYLSIVSSKDLVLNQEERVLERKEEIMETLEIDSLNEYYEYLNSRFDVLKRFPSIQFEYEDTKNKGYIIDIREYGEEKLIILQLKDNINQKFLAERQAQLSLITYARDGYIIPEKSLVKVDGKDNIVIMSKGYLKKYVEVTISNKNNGNVFLANSENENITNGMRLIVNP
ncbi:hypothetical protein GC105_09470 [Alkalibaculum sp. M08DMB]|uniref:Membrane fusion protein n=1 Tax=Alkalibaculum sporogenes TaxID=2655001 RepID=A0A6A7K968_9FIRM|nr:HlyD family efflux transporter periplasmic adaptor subunit [Alkalibaculum sporogenes]MPW26018.1 hypothetical protein [Alkalibaculum sporogenes]